jgi:prepilin-type N-terminal cleavage/methylation domain-containing protein
MFSQPLGKKKAFTLVELLVVIAIVGLLSTIVLVSTSGLREQAEIAKTLQWSKSVDSLLGANAVGIWSMDENPASQGTVIKDMSGWGNDGTLNTGETGINKSVTGVMGNALSFDGVDDYIDCGNDSSLNITDAITIEAWVKLNSGWGIGSSWMAIVDRSWGEDPRTSYSLVFRGTSGDLRLYRTNGTVIGTKTSWPANWYHIVGISSEAGGYLYINGTLDGSTPIAGFDTGANFNFRIGRSLNNQVPFNGFIDEVRIYNQALTASQIKSQYYAGLNRLLVKGLMDQNEYQEKLSIK